MRNFQTQSWGRSQRGPYNGPILRKDQRDGTKSSTASERRMEAFDSYLAHLEYVC